MNPSIKRGCRGEDDDHIRLGAIAKLSRLFVCAPGRALLLVFLAPGIWQQRDLVKPVGEGVYETSFVPPSAGVYYVFFQSASLGLQFNQSTPLTIQAVKN